MSSRITQLILIISTCLVTIAATDIFLPSLPKITQYFKIAAHEAQLAIPICMFGQLLGAPVWGITSDNKGRKPVWLLGLNIFLIGTIICSVTESINIFLMGRFFQGFGGIVGSVVGWATIKDLYPGDEGAKIVNWVGSIIIIGPIIAPVIGGYIDITYGWQFSFYLIAALGAVCLGMAAIISPTNPALKTSKVPALKTYITIVSDRKFLSYISVYSVMVSGVWCYLTVIPFYFENTLHLTSSLSGFYISLTAGGFILGSFITDRFLKYYGIDVTMKIGIWMALLGSTMLILLSCLYPNSPLFIAVAVSIILIGETMVWSGSTSRSLQRFDNNRGAASAVRTLVVMIFIMIGGLMGSILDDTILLPMSIYVMITAIGALLIFNNIGRYNK